MGIERAGFVLAAGAAIAAFVAGCGDPPICPSDVFVVIQTSGATTDVDPAVQGVQAEVSVRSSLAEGQEVSLDVVEDGRVTTSLTGAVDAAGVARFVVTLRSQTATLRASIDTTCGVDSDEVDVQLGENTTCSLMLSPTPEQNDYYAPLGVLVASTDPDPNTPGHEESFVVGTRPGWTVELVEIIGDEETIVGSTFASNTGVALFTRALPDGTLGFEARCHDATRFAASARQEVIVDTAPPTCALVSPTIGTTITPGLDDNSDLADGIQAELDATVDGPDVDGELVTITLTPTGGSPMTTTGSPVASNATSATVTFAPETTPATFAATLAARDHAGNACTFDASYDVVYEGCELAISAPTGVVTADADGNATNGSQADVEVQVELACAGNMVTSTCGSSPSGVVPASGKLALRPTVCTTSPCERELPCSVEVTNGAGVATRAVRTIVFDTQGPEVAVALVEPAVTCGAQLTSASDAIPSQPGVQLVAGVISEGTGLHQLQLANTSGTATFNAAGSVALTLARGLNRITGIAFDEHGNRSQTASCNITLTVP